MANKLNIPKIRFPWFESEWEEKKFSSIYNFILTNSLSRDKLNYEDWIVKNIHYWDIHTKFNTSFKINRELVPYINLDIDLSKLDKNRFCKEWDLVIADASEDYKDIWKAIEIIDLDNQKVLSWLHTYIARPKNKLIYKGFWWYLMKNYNVRHQIMFYATWIKVLWISKGNLWLVNLNLPSIPEQQKIASFLLSVDEKIEKIKEKKKNLEEYKKWISQKIFSQEIRFKDENWKEFGEWEERRLGKISKITTWKLDANAMVKNWKYRFYTCAKEYYKINNFAFDIEALLISWNGANVWYIHYYKWKFNAYQRTYVLHWFEENIFYIKHFLDKNLKKRIMSEVNEWNTPYIVISTLADFNIKLPTIKEQKKIASFLSSIDDKIENVDNEIKKMEEFKKGLLQNMFV